MDDVRGGMALGERRLSDSMAEGPRRVEDGMLGYIGLGGWGRLEPGGTWWGDVILMCRSSSVGMLLIFKVLEREVVGERQAVIV